jgi:hypothetical protein
MFGIPSKIGNRICHGAAAFAVLMLLTKIFLGAKYNENVSETKVKTLSRVELEPKYKSETTTLFNSSDTDADFIEIAKFHPKDPRVLDYLRKKRIFPPSTLPYALTDVYKKFPTEFKAQLEQIFANKSKGFFVECGANDGELLSNTLELETRGWTGLLVEAHPELGISLLTKNRKAWFANVCLSPFNNITEIQLASGLLWYGQGKGTSQLLLPDNKIPEMHKVYGLVQCFPLASLLTALDVKHVDYLTLDVQGVEFKILRTLPFDDSLVIDHIQVEIDMVAEGEKTLQTFLEQRGYELVFKHKRDLLFRRKLTN